MVSVAGTVGATRIDQEGEIGHDRLGEMARVPVNGLD